MQPPWKSARRVARLAAMAVLATSGTMATADAQSSDRFHLAAAGRETPAESTLSSRVSLSVRGIPLREALAVLVRSGAPLIYSDDLVHDAGVVTCHCDGLTLKETLDRVLTGTGISFRRLESGQVVLVAARAAGETQQGTITGQVVDAATRQPLSGAGVTVVGTGRGTLTSANGAFVIPGIPAGTYRVRASLIGYATQETSVTVADGQSVSVNLPLQAQAVELEGIVAVGYGTQQRRDVTGSIASVQADDIARQPLTSVDQVLQGRAPGVQVVQNSGAPGAALTVRIRGGNSVLGGNDPLYVVDGLPVDNVHTAVNPDDIASMEVLKDASATAIYGARGANGVVLITTRRGAAGTNRTEFETYVGLQQPRRKLPFLNAREFVQIATERAKNDRIANPFPDPTRLSADTDWQDEIFRNAPLQSYSLSFSGGTDQTRYLVSGNWFDQKGIIESSGYQRGTLRLNLDQQMSSRFRISNRFSISRAEADRILSDGEATVLLGALGGPPIVPVLAEDGSYSDINGFFFSTGTAENPVLLARDRFDRSSTVRILGSFSGEYDLFAGVKARSMVGLDYADNKSDYYAPRTLRSGRPAGVGTVGRSEGSSLINENTLTYDGDFGGEHRLNATAGFTWQQDRATSVSTGANGFVTDDLLNRNLGAGEIARQPSTGGSESMLISWLGRMNYTLLDRYILTLTGRADGSSRFGTGNKWALFPSAALAWRISDEAFLRGADAISDLKLRVSWGRTGNQDIGVYQSLQRIVPVTLVFGTTQTIGFAPSNIANPDLKWETTEQIDVGMDLGLWNQRVRLTADAYRKNTTDLLALVQLPGSTGFTSSIQNIGAIRNHGVELGVGADLVDRESLSWSLETSLSANRNRVVRTAGGVDVLAPAVDQLVGPASIIRQGEPLGAFYGFVEDGLTDQGVIRYRDSNGDGTVNDDDRVIIGDPYPDLSFGLNTTLRIGSIELNAFVQGVEGMQVLNFNRFWYASSFNRGYNQVREVMDYWTPENPDAKYPRVSGTTNFRLSDRFVEDASYVRLKNVRVAYILPESWLRLSRAQSGTLYLSAQNLWTSTPYTWFDPEVSSFGGSNLQFGIDRNTYPTARTFTLGAQFGL